MAEISSNKTIAKNTVYMYFRMALVTIVGLYTSRVILATLGIDDYGIYTIAGSVVALFSFITGALGQSSSRYITVELGKVKDDDLTQLIKCFLTTKSIHIILAFIIFLLCETIGLWVLYKSAIPEERITAAFWVFQISTLTAMLNVIQIPFTALIIAHEKMGIYAYISIFEVVGKLLICYLLFLSPIDKLIFYAFLLLLVQSIVFLIYFLYCKRSFKECKMGFGIDGSFFRPILSFSFWNLFGSMSYAALTQGTTILVGFFFGPAIVSGRAIANQVKQQIINFVTSFRTAINPQILKRHAAGETTSYKHLLMWSANVTFYMMLVLVLPLFFAADFVLDIWLKEVPQLSSAFLKIALLEMLFYVYDVTFFQIFQSEGRLKENGLICPIMDFIGFAIVYLIYLCGGSVLSIAWMMVALTVLQGMVVKPYLAVRMFGFKWSDFLSVYKNNLLVTLTSVLLPAIIYLSFEHNYLVYILLIIISVVMVLLSSFYVGMTINERKMIKELVLSKVHKK